ncbi:MAG: ThiF family adenylyltransferase, partial [Verrucomicrobiota bacterium]
VSRSDIIFGAAPLFEERLLLNREAVLQKKPLVDCAMYNLEGHVIPVLPGKSACLACLYPETPPHWKRRFPVLGAVSALTANIGALEGIKMMTNLPKSNAGKMIYFDARTMRFQQIALQRRTDCKVCVKMEK